MDLRPIFDILVLGVRKFCTQHWSVTWSVIWSICGPHVWDQPSKSRSRPICGYFGWKQVIRPCSSVFQPIWSHLQFGLLIAWCYLIYSSDSGSVLGLWNINRERINPFGDIQFINIIQPQTSFRSHPTFPSHSIPFQLLKHLIGCAAI